MELRDYQLTGVRLGAEFARTAGPQSRLLLAAPTGTGKSYVILALLDALPGWVALCPSLDIIAGMLNKLGVVVPATDNAIAELAAQHRLYTPLRFRNALLSGALQPPAGIVSDEAHHEEAQTHHDISALCACPKIGITATPYRGTAAGTAAFRSAWGEPVWLVTLRDAQSRGVVALPTCETWPLVDDDLIEVSGGELVASQVVGATRDKLADLFDRCAKFFDGRGCPTRPTVFAMPTGDLARAAASLAADRGWAAVCVTQETTRAERAAAYKLAAAGVAALFNVRVVGEGVDLPLRRYIDCAPTLSPVLWLQRLGRITRPSLRPPEYVCCNNNLQRFFYLLDGCVPPAALSQSISAFGKLTPSAGRRAFGLEGVGKLRPIECKLHDGLTAHCYSVTQTASGTQTQFFVIVHPSAPRPIWCRRENVAGEYGQWRRCDAPAELQGFRSVPQRVLSAKQAEWWQRDAAKYGLADTEPTTKLFPVLPVLSQLKLRLA